MSSLEKCAPRRRHEYPHTSEEVAVQLPRDLFDYTSSWEPRVGGAGLGEVEGSGCLLPGASPASVGRYFMV